MATMDIAGRNAEEDAAVARVDGSPVAELDQRSRRGQSLLMKLLN